MKRLLALFVCVVAGNALADDVTLPDAERIVLGNGAVLILNEKHDVPLLGMELVIRGGAVADPDDKHGLANLLAGLLGKGAGGRNPAEFAEASAAVGGELRARAALESLDISADFMSKDAALMVELVADMLQRPSLSAAEFAKLRERSINLIKAAKGSDPGNLIPAYASAFLFGEHPYGNPVSGSESSLENISHSDLLAFYADHVGADRLTIAVSGDFDTAEMKALLSDAFGAWRPAAGVPPAVGAPDIVAGSRVFLIDKPGATQTYFRIGNLGVARNYSSRASLDLANTVFGGRFTSMLMTELRTKSGLSYGARSVLDRHSMSGSFFISSFTASSTTVEAINVALGTLRQLRDQGLSDEMIISARNYLLGQFPTRFETASQLASVYAMLESQGLDSSYIDDYGSSLAAATDESIAATIDDVYPPSNELVFVILGDASIIREQLSGFGPITETSITAPKFHP